MPTGVNLNQYAGPGSCIPWQNNEESLFGPQNQPKLVVSVCLGHSVEFQVRRAPRGVPPPIRLGHGDILVMDGLAQSEYEHRTVSGLQRPRVNLTFRWVTQHIASCPQAGAMYCTLPSSVQGSAEPGPPRLGKRESQWCCFWVVVLLLSIWVCFLLGRTWLDALLRKRWLQWSASILPSGALPFKEVLPAELGAAVLATVAAERFPKRCSMPFPLGLFFFGDGYRSGLRKPCSFYGEMWVVWCVFCWIYWQARREATPWR